MDNLAGLATSVINKSKDAVNLQNLSLAEFGQVIANHHNCIRRTPSEIGAGGFDFMSAKIGLLIKVLKKSKNHCWYCGKLLTIESRYEILNSDMFVADHLIPRILGGSDEIENIVPACWGCNCEKGIRSLEEFRHYKTRKFYHAPKFTDEQILYLSLHGLILPVLTPYIFYFESEGLTP
jgi:hypothetical protein